jgi:hypothetical protein
VPTLQEAEPAKHTSRVNVDLQLLRQLAGGDSLPDFLLSDVPLDDSPHPEVRLRGPSLTRMKTYLSTDTPLSDYLAEPCQHDAQGCHELNLQNNRYYLVVTGEEYNYIQ